MESKRRMFLVLVICIVLQFGTIIAVDELGEMLFPAPTGFVGDRVIRQMLVVSNYPTWFLGLIVVFWSFTTFCIVSLASRIGSTQAGYCTTWSVGMSLGWRFYQCAYPIWFVILMVVCFGLVVNLVARIEKIGRYAVKKSEP